MREISYGLSVLLSIGLVWRLEALPAKKDPSKELIPSQKAQTDQSQSVRPTMQKYSENVGILLQNMRGFEENPSPEKKVKVLATLKILKGLSHNVQASLANYEVDPVMKSLSLDLPQQFARIETAYEGRRFDYAYFLLRQTTQYCIACHASSSIKQSAPLSFPQPIAHLSDMEKAEYFGATRQHEQAMLAYEHFLADKELQIAEADLWLKAMSNLLAITIRIRNDAAMTLEMISARLEKGPYLPRQMELLQTWRNSAKQWSLEPLKQQRSSEELLLKAETLLDSGRSLALKGVGFGIVDLMRAMNLLNEINMSQTSLKVKAKAYLLSGRASEYLNDLFVWMHPETYYEACIRIHSQTRDAKECLKALEEYQKGVKYQIIDPEKFLILRSLASN